MPQAPLQNAPIKEMYSAMPDIRVNSLEGQSFGAYCAMPPGGSGPGLVVIQEIFGINAGMRQLCDFFASKGYIAVCPDLFWRQQPGVQLTDQTQAEWDKAFALFNGFDVEAGVRDLLSTLAHVRAIPGCTGKVGAIGYCLGGKMAFLMASRSDVDATVGYYGVGLENLLDEVLDVRMPLLLHMAALDKFVPETTRAKILKSTSKNPVITAHTYEGADHAFARPNGQTYNEAAAKLAETRTLAFFEENLKA